MVHSAFGEYYHIFNRGVGKKTIFYTKKEYARFILLILALQGPVSLKKTNRVTAAFAHDLDMVGALPPGHIEKIAAKRYVSLCAFCLMPNHFHLLLKEESEAGIPTFMQRIQTAYTMYYNTRYETSGHLFQGPYKLVHIETDRQLLHTSAYIHRNPIELGFTPKRLAEYPWSSLTDYIHYNRWGRLLNLDLLVSFSGKGNATYEHFVLTSSAKEEAESFLA